MKRAVLIPVVVVLMLFVAGSLAAQSNEVIDSVLEQETLRTAEALYLVRVAAGDASEDQSVQDVYASTDWASWGLEEQAADEPVTLGQFSYLVMQALDMSGGLMYKIFPGPRYAARELDYLGYIAEDRSPYRTMSGQEGLRILGEAMRAQSSTASS
jgi:hypothetical protein